MSTPKFAHIDTKRKDGFYVQFEREVLPDDDCELRTELSGARKRAFERGQWHYVGIRARAMCMIVQSGVGTFINLESPGLWGVESDSGDEYLDEVFREEVASLKSLIEAMRKMKPQYEGSNA
jgi:hypothetical protein